MTHFKIPGTVRASFAFYTTEEIDLMVEAIKEPNNVF
jgi:selenocysteine lyase/cysteine desulfurase